MQSNSSSGIFLLVAFFLCGASLAAGQMVVATDCVGLQNSAVISVGVPYTATVGTVIITFTDPSASSLVLQPSSPTFFNVNGNNFTVTDSLLSVIGTQLVYVISCSGRIFSIDATVVGNSVPQWSFPSGKTASVIQYTLPGTQVITAIARDSVSVNGSPNVICSGQISSPFFNATISGNNTAQCSVTISVVQIFSYLQLPSLVTATVYASNIRYPQYPYSNSTATLNITIVDTDTIGIQWINAPYSVTLPANSYTGSVSLPTLLQAINGNPGIVSPPSTNFTVIGSTGVINSVVLAPQSSTSSTVSINLNGVLLPGSTSYVLLGAGESGSQVKSNITYLQINVSPPTTTTSTSTTTTPCFVQVPLPIYTAPNAPMFIQSQFQFSVLDNVPIGFTLADFSSMIIAKGSASACYSTLVPFWYSWQVVNGSADWQDASRSSALQTVNLLNYSLVSTYTLRLSLIAVYDNSSVITSALITIYVIESNANPQIAQSSNSATVNIATISQTPAFIANISASSPSNSSLQYAILDNTDIFSISPSTGALYLISMASLTSSAVRSVSIQICDSSFNPRCSYTVFNVSMEVSALATTISMAALSWGLFGAVAGVIVILLIVAIAVWRQRKRPIEMKVSDVPKPNSLKIIAPYIAPKIDAPHDETIIEGDEEIHKTMYRKSNGHMNGTGDQPSHQDPFASAVPWDRDRSPLSPKYYNAILDKVSSMIPRKGRNRPAIDFSADNQPPNGSAGAAADNPVFSPPSTLRRKSPVSPSEIDKSKTETAYTKTLRLSSNTESGAGSFDEDNTIDELYARIRTGNPTQLIELPLVAAKSIPPELLLKPAPLPKPFQNPKPNLHGNQYRIPPQMQAADGNNNSNTFVAQARFNDDEDDASANVNANANANAANGRSPMPSARAAANVGHSTQNQKIKFEDDDD